jgi:hypothetical protein
MANEVTQLLAGETEQKTINDRIVHQCIKQLQTSRDFKRGRLAEIQESEDLYLGKTKPSLANPFNECFPFMSGFVEHYVSKIDNPPTIDFGANHEADFKIAEQITSAYEIESADPIKQWARIDRECKRLAVFSGLGIYKQWADSPTDPDTNEARYQAHFDTKDIYEWHFEPNGGGHLEDHLFCGEEGVFMTMEEIEQGGKDGYFDEGQVTQMVQGTSESEYKDNAVEAEEHMSRRRSLMLDPTSHNYVGQQTKKLVEWYTTFGGKRYYVLFDEKTSLWLRVETVKEMFGTDLYPYVVWHTHEDRYNMLSKAPCDDAKPVAKYINRLLNQLLYNREKKNRGQRAYDPEMFQDVEALSDWRPDGLIPVDTQGGQRSIASGIFEFQVGGLDGTIDLITFLDAFSGQKTGSTPGSQGASDKDKKVGVFFGELDQVSEFIGTRNKSYTEAWAQLGIRYIYGLDHHLDDEGIAIELMGPDGIEYTALSRFDMKRNRQLSVRVRGGAEDFQRKEVEKKRKAEILPNLQTVSPEWKEREILAIAGYTDAEIKEAFTQLPYTSRELISEAMQAVEDILVGKRPALNYGANVVFMQRIIDKATDVSMSNKARERKMANQLLEYAMAHTDIVLENETRLATEMIRNRNMAEFKNPEREGGGVVPQMDTPPPPPTAKDFIGNPEGTAISNGLNKTAQVV